MPDLTRENRPKAAHESPTKAITQSLNPGTDFTAEDRHAAYCAGYDDGMHHKFGLEVEDRARALLLAWSNESRELAAQYARVKGPAWAAMVAESGDRE